MFDSIFYFYRKADTNSEVKNRRGCEHIRSAGMQANVSLLEGHSKCTKYHTNKGTNVYINSGSLL
jgi:hypothetical protein